MEARLYQIGSGAGLTVPKDIVQMFGWKEDDWLSVAIDGKRLKRRLQSVGGSSSLGVFIPGGVLAKHGWSIGDTVETPYQEWRKTSAPKREAPRKDKVKKRP